MRGRICFTQMKVSWIHWLEYTSVVEQIYSFLSYSEILYRAEHTLTYINLTNILSKGNQTQRAHMVCFYLCNTVVIRNQKSSYYLCGRRRNNILEGHEHCFQLPPDMGGSYVQSYIHSMNTHWVFVHLFTCRLKLSTIFLT